MCGQVQPMHYVDETGTTTHHPQLECCSAFSTIFYSHTPLHQHIIFILPSLLLLSSSFINNPPFSSHKNLQYHFRFQTNSTHFHQIRNLFTECEVGIPPKPQLHTPLYLVCFKVTSFSPISSILTHFKPMSAAMMWVVSPNSEVCNQLGFLETTRTTDSSNKKGLFRNERLKNVGRKRRCYPVFNKVGSRRTSVARRVVANLSGNLAISSEQLVYDVVLKQAALVKKQMRSREEDVDVKPEIVLPGNLGLLNEAYDRCGEVCAEYAKTFYLGTLLMTPERRKAIWAIYVWCRRTDELVDGPNASHITPKALDRWESRLEDLFNGRPFDMLDAALSDTVSKFPVDIQPFKDMIDGMRMDLRKSRYENFDELYLYCYYVAGTVGLMSVPIMGIAPESNAPTESVYNAALALGIANQLTNILRDVGEDARRGRVYLPQDELAQAGLSDEDIFAMKVTDKWRFFMKKQIHRARTFFDQAEEGVTQLSSASRWPVWASLLLYRQILDEIEANDYNNFTKRAYVSKPKKIAALPVAYAKSLVPPSSRKLASN